MRKVKEEVSIGTEVMLKYSPIHRERVELAFKKTKIIGINTYPHATQYKLAIDEGKHIWDSEMVEKCTCDNCLYEKSSVNQIPCSKCCNPTLARWVSKYRKYTQKKEKHLKVCMTCKFYHQCSNEYPCRECFEASAWETNQATTTTNAQPSDQQHYRNCVGEQPIEVMLNKMSSEEFIGFLKGNILKYTLRMGKKEGEPVKKEARKVLQYAKWLEQFTNTGTIKVN